MAYKAVYPPTLCNGKGKSKHSPRLAVESGKRKKVSLRRSSQANFFCKISWARKKKIFLRKLLHSVFICSIVMGKRHNMKKDRGMFMKKPEKLKKAEKLEEAERARAEMNRLESEYWALGGNEKHLVIEKILTRMELTIENIPKNMRDIRDEEIIQLAKFDIAIRNSMDFMEHCTHTKPILDRLEKAKEWDLKDVRILGCALLATNDIKRAQKLLKRGIELLEEKYSGEEFCQRAILALKYNFCNSVLKAHALGLCQDMNLAKLLEDTIGEIFVLSRNVESFHPNYLIARARLALSKSQLGNAEAIVEELKDNKLEDLAKILKEEIIRYQCLSGGKLTDEMYDHILVEVLRKIRRTHNLTLEEFADTVGIPYDIMYGVEEHKKPLEKAYLISIAETFNTNVEKLFDLSSVVQVSDKDLEFKKLANLLNPFGTKGVRRAHNYLEKLVVIMADEMDEDEE